jgi:hypothetical protein
MGACRVAKKSGKEERRRRVIKRLVQWNAHWKNEFQLPVPKRKGRVCTADATPTDVAG